MRSKLALVIVALLSVSTTRAQERSVLLLALSAMEDVQGQWEIQCSMLPRGGLLYIETRDGASSTLEIPEGSSVRIIGRKFNIKITNLNFHPLLSTILVGDVLINIAPTLCVSNGGEVAFSEARTKLRYLNAAVGLRRYEN